MGQKGEEQNHRTTGKIGQHHNELAIVPVSQHAGKGVDDERRHKREKGKEANRASRTADIENKQRDDSHLDALPSVSSHAAREQEQQISVEWCPGGFR